MEVEDGQRKGRSHSETMCQLPEPHQALVRILAESQLRKRKIIHNT